jgi:hypothetical protein
LGKNIKVLKILKNIPSTQLKEDKKAQQQFSTAASQHVQIKFG